MHEYVRFVSPRDRRGFSQGALIGVIAVVAVLIVVFFVWIGAVETESEQGPQDIHNVSRGDFMITIPSSGELSANRLVEIRNPLETSGLIMDIVNEGEFIRKGDPLIKFNPDTIEDRIKDVEDELVDAKSRVVTAEQSLEIAKSTMESNIEKADLSIEIAQLALQGWQEGDHIKLTQQLELGLETAKINAERLKKRFEEAKGLVENGFISQDEYERDRIAMIESAASVTYAALDLDVYTRFTSKQDEKQKISDVDQAVAERARVKQRHNAELVTQVATVDSVKKKLLSTQERLDELQEQFSLCTIFAPTDGLVVYKTSLSSGRWGRDDDNPPTVGTSVSPNELVILLPDTSQMIANVKVSEALSGKIQQSQPAIVYSEAHPNTPIRGTVQGVSVLAEGGGWRDPNRRDYTVRILLDADPAMELKPSMRCRAEIQLGTVTNAISVPIQSIFREGPLAYVYVPESGGWSQREVVLGRASELAVEVVDGVQVGDTVLLREPKTVEVVSRISTERLERNPSMPGASGRPGGSSASGRPSSSGKPGGSGKPPSAGGKPERPTAGGQSYQGAQNKDSAPQKPEKTSSSAPKDNSTVTSGTTVAAEQTP